MLTMFVMSTEKFLEAFEKKVSSKHEVLSEYFNPILSFILSKFQLFSIFLTYNLIDVSYDYDFFTEAKNQVSRTFQIPSTCLQSPQKIL